MVRKAMILPHFEKENAIVTKNQGEELRLPRVMTEIKEVEEVTQVAEMKRTTDREPNAENWKEVIPIGRKVQKKFKVDGKRKWYVGKIKAVKTEDKYPVEVKFEDGTQESWTFAKFAEEVEKGKVQLMG